MEERIEEFVKLKSKLSVVSEDYLYGADYSEEKRILETRLNEALKTLSADKLSEIVNSDFQACVDFKTATPLLWICGLDLNELPKGTTFKANYSPDIRIGIETVAEDLCFSVEVAGEKELTEKYCSSCYWFQLSNMSRSFRDILETVEHIEKKVLGKGEKLTDKELERIRDFNELKEQLIEAYHELAGAKYDYIHSDADRDIVHETYKKVASLETRLNETRKTLLADELTEIIEKDLKTCIDYKTADPLLWACGLNLKELPMSLPLHGHDVGVEYSPGVWIYIAPGEHHLGELENLCFYVEDTNENHSFYSGFESPDDMKDSFLDILETAEAYREESLAELEDPDEER